MQEPKARDEKAIDPYMDVIKSPDTSLVDKYYALSVKYNEIANRLLSEQKELAAERAKHERVLQALQIAETALEKMAKDKDQGGAEGWYGTLAAETLAKIKGEK